MVSENKKRRVITCHSVSRIRGLSFGQYKYSDRRKEDETFEQNGNDAFIDDHNDSIFYNWLQQQELGDRICVKG